MNRLCVMVVWHYEKSKIMKPTITNQEILLFAGTSFSSRQFTIKDPDGKDATGYSPMENLEKACWAGMLSEILPELVGCPSPDNKTYIWHILSAEHFLRISMGPYPALIENETSVDPYFFLPAVNRC